MPVLLLFVSDGAGSARHGGEGAGLAIEAAVQILRQELSQAAFSVDERLAVALIKAVRQRIHGQAESQRSTIRDYACTFLGAVSTPHAALAFQVGDGAIVVDVGMGLEVAMAPMSGEYANMTQFVTDDDALAQLKARVYGSSFQRVAALSDGLQRLALNLANNTPHEPFFEPFFRALTSSVDRSDDELEAALVRFLRSDAVNKRTDDDKTLAVAVQLP